MVYIKLKNRHKIYVQNKVTIITPTHKRLTTLAEAIDSVKQQTYANWEQIIVSDGYDENVKTLIDSINDPRIIYHYTFPLHVMGNYQRNKALQFMTGEFILYLDDDNIIFENCLATMVYSFTSNDIGYVIAPIFYGKEKNIMSPRYPFKFGEIDLLNYIVRRELVIKIGGQGMHGCADLFLIQKIANISKGNYIDAIIGYHR